MTSNKCIGGWTTSRDLDVVMGRKLEVSSAYLKKLNRDRDRYQEIKSKSLQNIPACMKQMIGQSDQSEGGTIRRWVALPPSNQRKENRNHAHSQLGTPMSTSTTTSRTGYCTDSVHGGPRDSHLSHRDTLEPMDYKDLYGLSTVPFKCPLLFSSSKKCSISPRFDTQTELRKVMRHQMEQQRNTVLTNHVEFVTSNTLNGTQLSPPSGSRVSYQGQITAREMAESDLQLLAILSVQEHNVPTAYDMVDQNDQNSQNGG